MTDLRFNVSQVTEDLSQRSAVIIYNLCWSMSNMKMSTSWLLLTRSTALRKNSRNLCRWTRELLYQNPLI
jgi:hypothetical protein